MFGTAIDLLLVILGILFVMPVVIVFYFKYLNWIVDLGFGR